MINYRFNGSKFLINIKDQFIKIDINPFGWSVGNINSLAFYNIFLMSNHFFIAVIQYNQSSKYQLKNFNGINYIDRNFICYIYGN